MIDDYYGTEVSDPYRYMENLQDPAVQSWFVLAGIPGRGKLLARIVELGESTSADVGAVHRLTGDLYIYKKHLATESVAEIYKGY